MALRNAAPADPRTHVPVQVWSLPWRTSRLTVLAKRASSSSPAQDAVHAMQTRPRGAGAAVDKLVSEVFFQIREPASRPVGRGGQPRAGKRRHTYTEIKQARRCGLIFFGIEVSGRWAPRATTFVRLLARVRAAVGLAPSRAAARVCGFCGGTVAWTNCVSAAAPLAHDALGPREWQEKNPPKKKDLNKFPVFSYVGSPACIRE